MPFCSISRAEAGVEKRLLQNELSFILQQPLKTA
jgi:hypothetical protein